MGRLKERALASGDVKLNPLVTLQLNSEYVLAAPRPYVEYGSSKRKHERTVRENQEITRQRLADGARIAREMTMWVVAGVDAHGCQNRGWFVDDRASVPAAQLSQSNA